MNEGSRWETFQDDLLQWSRDDLRSFPWRADAASPYQILVSEIFLQQTRASTVAQVYGDFFEHYPTLESLRDADPDELIEILRPLGLYNNRSEALLEIGHRLAGKGVPCKKSDLTQLPQVGRYAANATLAFGFDKRKPIVDSNIRRVLGRICKGSGSAISNQEAWKIAERILPQDDVQRFNLALLDFGSEICTNSSPACDECFANDYCEYYNESSG